MIDTTDGEESGLDEALLEASETFDGGDAEESLRMLLELERDHPEDARLLCMIGVVANQLGAEGMAVDFFQRCLAQEPMDPEILVQAGAGLAAAGDAGGEPALRLAALAAPDMALARLHYGSYLVRNGLVAQGLEELLVARDLDPDTPLVRREMGIGLLLAGREAEALDELESAVAVDPDDAEVRFLFGLVLLQKEAFARAAEELHPAAEGLADEGQAQLILALVFAHEDWIDEAWLAVSRAESAAEPADPWLVREVEDALEGGEEAIRSLLMSDLAPTALRARIYRG